MPTLEFEIDDHDSGYKCVAPVIKKICEDYKNLCDLHIKAKLNGTTSYHESEEFKDVYDQIGGETVIKAASKILESA